MIEEYHNSSRVDAPRSRRWIVVVASAALCGAVTWGVVSSRSTAGPIKVAADASASSSAVAPATVQQQASPEAFAALQASLKDSVDFPVAALHGKAATSRGHVRKSSTGTYCIETSDGGSCLDAPTNSATLTLLSAGGSSSAEVKTIVILVPKQFKEIVVTTGDQLPVTLPSSSFNGPQSDGLVAFEATAGSTATAVGLNGAGKPQSSLKITLGAVNQPLTEVSPGVFVPA